MSNTTLEKWEEKTLGEICKKISAGGDKPDVFSKESTDICKVPIYSNGIENNGLYGYTDVPAIMDEAITISARGTIGFVCKRCEPYYPIVRLISVIPNNYINVDFMAYALKFMVPTGNGSSIPQLTVPMLKNKKIKYPPLLEQERIVAKLDEAFEAIDKVKANAEQNLTNAKELYKVVLNRVFNSNKYQFEHIKLDDLCEIITDGTHQTPTYADKGVIFLSAKNVTSEVIDWENIKYISDSLHNELKKRVSPQKGDILLAKNGTTGVAAIVDRDCVFDIYVSLCMLRPKKTVNVQYLLLAINNPITKDKFNKSLIGIGVPNLHLNKIRETTVPIPSPKFQDEISSLLNGLKAEYLKLEQIYTQKIKECDELKQSILQKAFRGEL